MTPILRSDGNIQDYLPYNASARSIKWRVAESILQSAAIYSAALASLLGTYAAGSNAQYVCLDALQPLIVRRSLHLREPQMFFVALMYSCTQGVVFTLIIIRVGLGYTVSGSGPTPSDGRYQGPQGTSNALPRAEYPLHPVSINVSVSRTHDRASLEVYGTKEGAGDLEAGKSP